MTSLFHDEGEPKRGRKVLIATTAYNSPDRAYTFSMQRSRAALESAGIQTSYLLLSGNCHVDDARSTVVSHFLKGDCDELIFIDADVVWAPEDLLALCGFELKSVVGGVYPYRRDTEAGGIHMPVRNLPNVTVPDDDGLLEVAGLPTGFLKIRRDVFEKMMESGKLDSFVRDGERIQVFFERDILNDGRRGGDIGFCMRWREMGGQVHAVANLRLGHVAKITVRDSLAASLRRQAGQSLRYVIDEIRAGNDDKALYYEAVKTVANPWGASEDVLALCVLLARKARGPILEAGSGLSTILMAAAAPNQRVWVIEHSQEHAYRLKSMVAEAKVDNVALVTAPIKDGFYDLNGELDEMPAEFAVGLVDGPSRIYGDRMKFFETFGDRTKAIIADDTDDATYRGKLEEWAGAHDRRFLRDGQRAAVMLSREIELGA